MCVVHVCALHNEIYVTVYLVAHEYKYAHTSLCDHIHYLFQAMPSMIGQWK